MSRAPAVSRWVRLAALWIAATPAGCDFAPPSGEAQDASARRDVDGSDAGQDAGRRDASAPDATPPPDAEVTDSGEAFDGGFPLIPHLPSREQVLGGPELSLSSTVIDTARLTVTPSIAVAPFVRIPAAGGEPEIAVLRVARLKIVSDARVRVVGTRPLIIVSSGDIDIDGELEARGLGSIPGPGAARASHFMGVGEGRAGGEAGAEGRGGGGGGGHGSSGAAGGDAEGGAAQGGVGGSTFGDETIPLLIGGASGGPGAFGPCPRAEGGGGGGALQLYALGRLRVRGKINVSGGGGRGGVACSSTGGAGSGGGSGGALVLVGDRIEIDGELSAQGGGGGGGASRGTDPMEDFGNPGGDGLGRGPAFGGLARAPYGGRGGSGAAGALSAEPGARFLGVGDEGGHAGGGGGGVGRIRLIHRGGGLRIDGQVSPAPSVAAQ